MRTRLGFPFLLFVALVAVWCVVFPFIWAFNLGHSLKIGYWEMLGFYIPELVVGAVFLVCLPMVFLQRRIAVIGLVLAAILVPVLKLTIGSPGNVWPLTPLLLLFLSWRLHVLISQHA